jgi:metal iron transporter
MSEHPPSPTQPPFDSKNKLRSIRTWAKEARIHVTKHVGVGIICAVAYFDPYVSLFLRFLPQGPSSAFIPSGNWAVDLQAGSEFGYKLLFVVLLSGLCAVILQVSFFLTSF